MTQPHEIITVTESCFACDGSTASGAGHPRVYLTLAKNGQIDCPYCGRRFIADPHANIGAGH
ncbi:MAG: zinc-finger domain-containing protein [Alphaproteobacteria bacterium]